MKRLLSILLWLYIFVCTPTHSMAQDSIIPLPNNGFEAWSNGSGYSVTVIIFPLQVYGSYTYPTNWNYPTYPVNENITYSGVNVNVNTNLPLLKVSRESNSVAEGSYALKLQSFMASDIVSSTVYNLAASSLDPMLTTTVFPTVLSTGSVDIDQLLPLMSDVTSNLGNLTQLMSVFDGENLNNYVSGGLDLNGAKPYSLTGHYKYTSAVGGDNGGILLLGTKTNPSTHRREVVGAGYTIALTDTANYTPFEVSYTPLSEINSSYSYTDPDSLVIFIFSSANTTPQQGSALYLDNLQLWAQNEEVAVEDTCTAIFNLSVSDIDTNNATLSWTYEGTPDHFEVEYGVQGFTLGNGTTGNAGNSTFELSELQSDTYYDVYVRSACDEELFGTWAMISFKTDTLVPPTIPDDTTGIVSFSNANFQVFPNPAQGQCTVRFDGPTPSRIQLYNIEGKLLQIITPDAETVPLSLPVSGVYILRIETEEGSFVRKIVNVLR